jgi:hypothetical protein
MVGALVLKIIRRFGVMLLQASGLRRQITRLW